jgi:SM-20-related protein
MQLATRKRASSSPTGELPAKAPTLTRRDDLLSPEGQQQIYEFLNQPGWRFGWKSHLKKDVYSFWHKHFAGTRNPDRQREEDCAGELQTAAPLIYKFWASLQRTCLNDHKLVRCYANGFSFGCDGTVHTDSSSPDSFTSIYYPNPKWNPDWGGETIFFNGDQTDILAAVYPKPNRMITFPGTMPHAARGVSRCCPDLRITLMFKTECENDRPPA